MAEILIVDDEVDIRTSLNRFLSKDKHNVTEAQDGKTALEILSKKKFDLVILDILMPGMTGIEVAKSIKKNPKTKTQKIVFLSVIALGEEGAKQIKDIKPEFYLSKPFELKDLRKTINEVLK